ncbi:DUF3616 domain-containing protein [Saccharopolyspora sp. MS10]|uniref:DUF3616 domain-containing protein n=1 Tax=Saccharopolyspora sp. MS10 TaxID=3385973 RepID=UPI0039A16F99
MGITRSAALRFGEDAVRARTHLHVSAVRTDGHHLWIGGDETSAVERFSCVNPKHADVYAEHSSYDLTEVLELPGEPARELDIEGLARCGPYLWAVGSHSSERKKPKAHHSDAKVVKRLAAIEPEPSRQVLARIAVEDGVPVRTAAEGHRSAALGEPGLLGLLAEDPHLAPFLGIPGRDNGFHVEGVAALGEPGAERVLLGLRGPVLRGWAVVLRLEPVERNGRLVPSELDGRRRYAKHFLDLDGLGVRDLCPQGEDLLVLAGPSMALDGPARIYRWLGGARPDVPEVVRAEELVHEADLPFGAGDDRAEGLAELPGGELLVVYDSPAPARRPDPNTVLADVVRLA